MPEPAPPVGAVSAWVLPFARRVQELALVSADRTLSRSSTAAFALELQQYHKASTSALASALRTDAAAGLLPAEAARRLTEDGPNVIPPPHSTPVIVRFLLAFVSGFGLLLWFAVFCVFLSWQPFGTPPSNIYNLVLAVTLLVVICVSSLVQFGQEYASSSALKAFNNLLPTDCLVVRGGAPTAVAARTLVRGDLVQLTAGMAIPADVRIVSIAGSLLVSNALLTGESEPIALREAPYAPSAPETLLEARNAAFCGASVLDGSAVGLVFATGGDTQVAKIARHAGRDAVLVTSLQREINRFVAEIAAFAFLTGTVVVVVWAAYLRPVHPGFMNVSTMIANAISVIVAFVPEGLPLALTIGLTVIVRRLCVNHFVLVKTLALVETLGSVSLVASDKTGTLTKNNMTVSELICFKRDDEAPSTTAAAVRLPAGIDSGGYELAALVPTVGAPLVAELLSVAVLCNAASVKVSKEDGVGGAAAPALNGADAPLPTIVGGNGVDKALLAWAMVAGAAAPGALPSVSALSSAFEREASLPFSSRTKTAAEVVRARDDARGSGALLLVKGAPEYILLASESAAVASADGAGEVETMILTPELRASLMARLEEASSAGKRVIALARRALPDCPRGFAWDTSSASPNVPTDGFTLLAFVAVSDPPRDDAPTAIAALRAAGIAVAMVTGDAPGTALAIASKVGILSVRPGAVEGVPEELLAPAEAPSLGAGCGGGGGGSDYGVQRAHAEALTSRSPEEPRVPTEAPPVRAGCCGCSASKVPPPSEALAAIAVPNARSPAALITGAQLPRLTPAGWAWVLSHRELVFARTTPEHKLQIVLACKEAGHRVSVTGDGVNDAPAIAAADVGVAMNAGSDVARAAAPVVLLKDSFAALVVAVGEGRLMFQNLRKVIAYQIAAGCYSELLPVLATFFFGMPQPLSSFLMIIISCVTDAAAGIALMHETAEQALMLDAPRDLKRTRLVPPALICYSYLFYGNMQSLAAFTQFFIYMRSRGPPNGLPTQLPADDDGVLPGAVYAYSPANLVFAWNWGAPAGPLGADETTALNTASSIFFVTLIVAQMGHLLSLRRSRTPYLSEIAGATPWQWLCNAAASLRPFDHLNVLGSWVFSFLIGAVITEEPTLQLYCQTAHVPGEYWGYAVAWGAAIFAVGELRKWLIHLYPQGTVAWLTGWA